MMKTSRGRLIGAKGAPSMCWKRIGFTCGKKGRIALEETPLSEFDPFRFLDVHSATFPIKWLQPEDANPGQRTAGSSAIPVEASLKRFLSKG
ncbi:hypothetical protein KEC55_06900 [Burkholderia cepacia]|uniref:hypothetical protein n=1 Tax=Burkholderia cepacia TaxID=292 RepID=UPI00249F3183|nr:hypothetical protein [Burkholderia cepacia]WGY69699.1 hypothetical protein KEC55_06900 [Burkholderia cepacia]